MATQPTIRMHRYSTVAIVFHWTISALMIVNLALGLGHESFGKANVPVLMGLHKSIGFTVLVLSLMRLAWRVGHPAPALPAATPGWQRLAAHGTHIFFYFVMIALPMTGWLMSSAAPIRYPLDYFGLINLPYLPVEQAKSAAGLWHESHELLGFATIAILILHVAAALKHHFWDRDDVLVRMLPKS